MKTLVVGWVGIVMAGCQPPAVAPSRPITSERARFYLESTEESAPVVTMPRSGVQLAIGARPVFSEPDIAAVSIVHLDQGPALAFRLTAPAGRDLQRLTAANPGRKLVLLLGDVALGARQIDQPLDRGVLVVFVEAPDAALPALVESLNATTAAVRPKPAHP